MAETATTKTETETGHGSTGELTAGTAVPADAHAKKAFPPLDPSTFAPQLIWLALTFGTLYFLLSKIVLPRIGGVIDERKRVRQSDLDEAERLKNETDKALKDYEKSLSEAKSRASGIAQSTRDKLKAEVDGERARVDRRSPRRRRRQRPASPPPAAMRSPKLAGSPARPPKRSWRS